MKQHYSVLAKNKILKPCNSPKAASVQQMDVDMAKVTHYRHPTAYLELQLATLFAFHSTHASIK
jgi:hypothetical protein